MTHWSRHYATRLLALGLLAGCESDPTAVTRAASPTEILESVTDDVVAAVFLIPDSQLVFFKDRFTFVGQAKNAAGEILDRTIQWTLGNPALAKTISSTPTTITFKPLLVGTTTVTARADGVSRTGKIVVRGLGGARLVVTPAQASLVGGETVQFLATGLTKFGESATVNVTWTATGGTISGSGVYTGGSTPGTYRVIGATSYGLADTSTVVIAGTGGGEGAATSVVLVPESVALAAGGRATFAAYGRTSTGDSVSVNVTYAATGGTIATNGVYTAGTASGSYRVIASGNGVADTSEVTISPASIAKVILLPDVAASRAGATTRFTASARNTSGDSVGISPAYAATCGAITAAGVYTAPANQSGSCLVTASVEAKADTTAVVLLADTPYQGVPFGLDGIWTSPTATRSSGIAAFTASRDYEAPSELIRHITEARALGIRLLLLLTGGSHDRYKTNGVFDMGKWQAAVRAFDTPAIRDAIAAGVADGTIIGNSVMDEPQQSGTTIKDWGPPGTMTKARVDSMCGYVKSIFSSLPVGVGHDHNAFEPTKSYLVCEFFMTQYAHRKGDINAWRDGGLAMAARDGLEIIYSINLLDGGVQDKSGTWDCAGTGGLGTHGSNCRMTADQVREWGKLLGQVGCALFAWRYDADYFAKPENQAAFSEVAISMANVPRRRCSRR
jgi:hypothetical protein